MPISESLLPEFEHEMATTRRVLERVPDDRLAWQPHPKSMTMGRLASHVAEVFAWCPYVFEQDSFDTATYQRLDLPSRAKILEAFERNVGRARELLRGADDSLFRERWSLLRRGETVFSLPRVAVYRGFLMNHLIHHRAQLTVYLRLNDVPVPAIYGASADEG
jgi:uncharacterized damage-inducible protein DinB